ncbi:MAG TPA: HAD family hydrolase, partial [Pyrinomonadaceae bacterium]
MIQAVFFDFNGVIVDDEPLQMKVYQEVLGGEGLAVTEEDYYGSLGMDDVAFVRAAFERAGRELTEETLGRVIEAKTAAHRKLLEGELPLFPGVVTFIKALKRGHSLGLVSMA